MINPNLETITLNKEEIERYSRHIILPEVGLEGQKKLKAASVICVGTGGLGSPLLLYLAAAGIGNIGIVDFDIVESSNLQRQIIHGASWVGKLKIESAKNRILEINPTCQVDLYKNRLSSENAIQILKPYDVVVDGTDNFPTRYLTNDACFLLNKPNIYGSIFRFEGQTTVFNYQGGPNYRDLFPEPPPPGMVPSCAEGGVLGVLPGIIGTIQATETIKVILGSNNTLSGRLLLYNAWDMTFKELKLRSNPNRPVINQLIDYEEFCNVSNVSTFKNKDNSTMISEIAVQELKKLIDSNSESFVLIDVRNVNERQIAHISGSVLVPLASIEDGTGIPQIRSLIENKRLIVHCKMGGRSIKALEILEKFGIVGTNLKGGINAWSQQIDVSIPQY
ncbi:molybdopterin-synthase adenylyltransferase MoeB [Candidatus Atelocyanobacterium thalassae]|mgnify:CR=1 FL=1|jgi:adenylyltransferase/sulfurtransferase|uniref:Dinucleotide-utilizing enzyme possibly involved in molybdopterin or thiamin biosynthesis n=1 Tax=Atelocyanobacterium thalassa (isolate ALOHA) TaxID=1453429 RepID=D3EPX2_ATETH|nr:molybdopterin-synthase adenylyltransferase MoeB [Candidatus Atelocyanobacterium thalassa]ADB95522.1 dinucleotide-utilizing enzyme possibly involved in molybdopterin or thiamin biosynthesis [Candidatus Atelocyanobacterium thalassa isolate ALOHA]MCH2543245.1 molybdopterin-synthase adenylyltransferase MoeB [Candidatus Atelocyanobacterium sp. ALOHA_A2.5_9]|tara:strand:- start:14812 stop:15987 length:1176 start_codon:yes stop_codon:yes gene_type:complete